MALNTLEEVFLRERNSLKILILRETNRLTLGKKPVNFKIANFVRKYKQDKDVWGKFLDSMNAEDLSRNLNVYDWKFVSSEDKSIIRRYLRLNSASRDVLKKFQIAMWDRKMSGGPQVRVAQGELLGRTATTPSGKPYFSFQGIPYAQPPIGSLRFKAPQAAEPWDGVRDATAEGNVCAQVVVFPSPSGFVGGEDCLFINVYTPDLEGQFLPVMVWSNSCGFVHGSGNTDMSGPDYLVEKDVVVVTFNYRSGPLGFLCLDTPEVPGNAGLKDQALALRWVKENIENFGGNSGNITVFGQSTGGISTSYLTLSPLTKDLMSKAIFQSGTSLNRWATVLNDPLENARKLAKNLGCESGDVEDVFSFLQTVPVKDLVEMSTKLQAAYISSGMLKFAPVIEKEFPGVEAFITEPAVDILTSGRGAKIPLMIGSAAQEAAQYLFITENFTIDEDLRSFIPKVFKIEHNSEKAVELAAELKKFYFNDAHIGMDSLNQYLNLLSDRDFLADIHRYVQILTQTSNQAVFYYRFSYNGGLNILRNVLDNFGLKQAGHMDELGYLFNISILNEVQASADDENTRERMVQMWTNFAKTGNPTPEENQHLNVTWLPVTKEREYYLDINKELTLATNIDQERMQFWDAWYSKYYKVWNVGGTPEKLVNVGKNHADDIPVNSQYEHVEVEKSQDVVTEQVVDDQKHNFEEEKIQDDLVQLSTVDEVESPIVEVKTIKANISSDRVEVEAPAPDVNLANGNEKTVSNGKNDAEEYKQNGKEEQEVIQNIDNVLIDEEKKEKLAQLKSAKVSNGGAKDIIRANDPPEDDLPKNIGVNRFVNFFESLGGKKK